MGQGENYKKPELSTVFFYETVDGHKVSFVFNQLKGKNYFPKTPADPEVNRMWEDVLREIKVSDAVKKQYDYSLNSKYKYRFAYRHREILSSMRKKKEADLRFPVEKVKQKAIQDAKQKRDVQFERRFADLKANFNLFALGQVEQCIDREARALQFMEDGGLELLLHALQQTQAQERHSPEPNRQKLHKIIQLLCKLQKTSSFVANSLSENPKCVQLVALCLHEKDARTSDEALRFLLQAAMRSDIAVEAVLEGLSQFATIHSYNGRFQIFSRIVAYSDNIAYIYRVLHFVSYFIGLILNEEVEASIKQQLLTNHFLAALVLLESKYNNDRYSVAACSTPKLDRPRLEGSIDLLPEAPLQTLSLKFKDRAFTVITPQKEGEEKIELNREDEGVFNYYCLIVAKVAKDLLQYLKLEGRTIDIDSLFKQLKAESSKLGVYDHFSKLLHKMHNYSKQDWLALQKKLDLKVIGGVSANEKALEKKVADLAKDIELKQKEALAASQQLNKRQKEFALKIVQYQTIIRELKALPSGTNNGSLGKLPQPPTGLPNGGLPPPPSGGLGGLPPPPSGGLPPPPLGGLGGLPPPPSRGLPPPPSGGIGGLPPLPSGGLPPPPSGGLGGLPPPPSGGLPPPPTGGLGGLPPPPSGGLPPPPSGGLGGLPSPPTGGLGGLPPPPSGGLPPPPSGGPLGLPPAPGGIPPGPMVGLTLQMIVPPKQPVKLKRKPKIPLKNCMWTTIPYNRIAKSIWDDFEDSSVPIDSEKLEKDFPKEEIKKTMSTPLTLGGSRRELVTLLSADRVKVIELVLGKLKLPILTITGAITACDQLILDLNTVQSLISLVPTESQIQTVTAFAGDPSDLGQPQAFVRELSRVSLFEDRLQGMKFGRVYNQHFSDLRHKIDRFTRCFNVVRTGTRFRHLLLFTLAVGNYMNGQTMRGGAWAIKLESVQKFFDVKAVDGSYCAAIIIFEMLKKEKMLPVFSFQEVEDIELVAQLPLKELQANLGDIRKGLRHIRKVLDSPSPSPDPFKLKYESVAAAVQSQLDLAIKQVEEVQALYLKAAEYLCEDAKEGSQVFGTKLLKIVRYAKKVEDQLENLISKREKALQKAASLKAAQSKKGAQPKKGGKEELKQQAGPRGMQEAQPLKSDLGEALARNFMNQIKRKRENKLQIIRSSRMPGAPETVNIEDFHFLKK